MRGISGPALAAALLAASARAGGATDGTPEAAPPVVSAAVGMSVADVRSRSSYAFTDLSSPGSTPTGEFRLEYAGVHGALPITTFCHDREVRHCRDSYFYVQISARGCVETFRASSGGLTARQALRDAIRWRDFFLKSGFRADPHNAAFKLNCGDKDRAPSCGKAQTLPEPTGLDAAEPDPTSTPKTTASTCSKGATEQGQRYQSASGPFGLRWRSKISHPPLRLSRRSTPTTSP